MINNSNSNISMDIFCRYGKNMDKVHSSLGDWDNYQVVDSSRDDQSVIYNFLALTTDNFPQQTHLTSPGFRSENICCEIQLHNFITNIWKLGTPAPKTICMHTDNSTYNFSFFNLLETFFKLFFFFSNLSGDIKDHRSKSLQQVC